MPTPKWMEDVAEAGGFEEHAKLKEQQKLIDKMNEIPVEKWALMATMTDQLVSIAELGGASQLLSSVSSSFKDAVSLEFNRMLAPLKNELYGMVNELIAPLYPYIEAALNGLIDVINLGTGAITALIEGKFDEWFRSEQIKRKEEIANYQYILSLMPEQLAGIYGALDYTVFGSLTDQIAQAIASTEGTEGGVYSGQFDIDMDALDRILKARLDQTQSR